MITNASVQTNMHRGDIKFIQTEFQFKFFQRKKKTRNNAKRKFPLKSS